MRLTRLRRRRRERRRSRRRGRRRRDAREDAEEDVEEDADGIESNASTGRGDAGRVGPTKEPRAKVSVHVLRPRNPSAPTNSSSSPRTSFPPTATNGRSARPARASSHPRRRRRRRGQRTRRRFAAYEGTVAEERAPPRAKIFPHGGRSRAARRSARRRTRKEATRKSSNFSGIDSSTVSSRDSSFVSFARPPPSRPPLVGRPHERARIRAASLAAHGVGAFDARKPATRPRRVASPRRRGPPTGVTRTTRTTRHEGVQQTPYEYKTSSVMCGSMPRRARGGVLTRRWRPRHLAPPAAARRRGRKQPRPTMETDRRSTSMIPACPNSSSARSRRRRRTSTWLRDGNDGVFTRRRDIEYWKAISLPSRRNRGRGHAVGAISVRGLSVDSNEGLSGGGVDPATRRGRWPSTAAGMGRSPGLAIAYMYCVGQYRLWTRRTRVDVHQTVGPKKSRFVWPSARGGCRRMADRNFTKKR